MPSSPESKGYLSLNLNGIGANYPAIQDIKKHLVDKGKSQTQADKLGENYYNRGVLNSVIVAEAIRNAQRITGKKVVNGEDVRRGFETLKITAERFKETRASRTSRRRSPTCRARITTAITRPSCSSGTAPSGSRSPTGSRP